MRLGLQPARSTAILAVLVALATLLMPRSAQANAQHEALLILRILAYDRNLTKRTKDEVVIAIVYKSGDAASERSAREIMAALTAAAKKVSVAGRKVRVRSEAYSADLAKNLTNTAGLYIATGLDDVVASVGGATRSKRVLSFTNQQAYLSDLAIAIVPKDKSMGIIVNLKAAKAEGADLDSALLRLADVRK